MTAAGSFARIVSLVAELSKDARSGTDSRSLAELATRHGVTTREIAADLRTLTVLGDRDADADWLLSLMIWQQGDQVSITSQGPFRRPVRLTPEEWMAVQLSLSMEPGGVEPARKLSKALAGQSSRRGEADADAPSHEALDLLRRAVESRSEVMMSYAGERDSGFRSRIVHPYQVVSFGIRTYLVAWATDVASADSSTSTSTSTSSSSSTSSSTSTSPSPSTQPQNAAAAPARSTQQPAVVAWRHFRLDRVMDVRLTGGTFAPRADFTPVREASDLFRGAPGAERVVLRYAASTAEWVAESYPDHVRLDDGRVDVAVEASSVEWLVRRALEHGTEVEVVGPPRFRDAVRRAVA